MLFFIFQLLKHNRHISFIILTIALFLNSCKTLEKQNSQLTKLHSTKEILNDIDFVQKKLKLHPSLYWYISKEELDNKFDSLKKTITSPLTSNEFYFIISPILSSIREGHLSITPIVKKYPKKQLKKLNKSKGPISQFEYYFNDQQLLILKNNSDNNQILSGSEVLSINEISPFSLFKKYANTYTSDGFNKTYIERTKPYYITNFYYYELGLRDSLLFKIKSNDSINYYWIKRKTAPKSPINNNKQNIESSNLLKINKKAEFTKRKINGFNKNKNQYSKELSFIGSDSSIAMIKINDFVFGNYKLFYQKSFEKIEQLKIKTLIIDLRGNKGGKLKEIEFLYSFLTNTNFIFSQKTEVASRFSLLHINYFGKGSLLTKLLKTTTYPSLVAYLLYKTEKSDDGKFYFKSKSAEYSKPRNPNYSGNIYVLIDGSSFSASCILASNLKGSKRAIFVGEETGGAYNGTVAGFLPSYTLPNTKLEIRLGLMTIKPYYQTDTLGRGIFPDITIEPKFIDYQNKQDSALKWIIENVNSNRN